MTTQHDHYMRALDALDKIQRVELQRSHQVRYGLTMPEWQELKRRGWHGLLTFAAIIATIYAVAVWV